MRLAFAVPLLVLPALLGACVQYPDGSWGPAPAIPPPVAYLPPPGPPVVYAPPSYGYEPGVPVYVMPQAPPPVVVAPSIGIGIGLGWGRGYWGRPAYWGRPGGYYRRW